MGNFTSQTYFSLVVGPIIFVVLLVPALVVQYRKFGRLSLIRLATTAAACVYAVALVAFTMFPLPTIAQACRGGRTGAILQPYPFHFLVDLQQAAARGSWTSALTGPVMLQVGLNVFLFLPLGLFLRRWMGRGLVTSVLIGFAVSLAIESTQFTGIWGAYPCGYRVADADDLLANTLGAWLGAVLAPRVLGWVPRPADLEHLAPPPVSVLRRWLGMWADLVLAWAVSFGCTLAYVLVKALFSDHAERVNSQVPQPVTIIAAAVGLAVVFWLPALRGTGASLGQRLLRIAPVWSDGRGATLGRRLGRTAVMGGALTVLDLGVPLLRLTDLPVVPGMIALVANLWLVLGFFWVLAGDHRGLSGRLSGARMVDVRTVQRTER